jgi:hypothetical protein
MVVRKIRVEVARGVICRWRIVWGERGRGMERWWGVRFGVVRFALGAEGAKRVGWDGASMMSGMPETDTRHSLTLSNGATICIESKIGDLQAHTLAKNISTRTLGLPRSRPWETPILAPWGVKPQWGQPYQGLGAWVRFN